MRVCMYVCVRACVRACVRDPLLENHATDRVGYEDGGLREGSHDMLQIAELLRHAARVV